jgi:c(7)-type cytochrome triheme protein
MHDQPRTPWRIRIWLALVALSAGLIWAAATAIAQPAGAGETQNPQPPTDLFGSLPEPPTEHLPAAPVLDPANPDYTRLQQPQEAFSTLPADRRGKPDWMRALRDKLIEPRSNVLEGQAIQPLALDILMKNTAQMPYVKFPHEAHTLWLECSNCHEAIFVARTGANPTDMARILRGESCGVCHTKVAFAAMYTCERCHSVPQPGQKPWW